VRAYMRRLRGWLYYWFLWSGESREKRKGTYVTWTDDGAVPVGHEDIIAILEAIRARSITDALLAFFEFF
jgi:hypothetical protein